MREVVTKPLITVMLKVKGLCWSFLQNKEFKKISRCYKLLTDYVKGTALLLYKVKCGVIENGIRIVIRMHTYGRP